MERSLNGKVAVITGGASGIGEATARLFVAEGAAVVIADVQDAAGEALASELGRAVFVRTDVSVEREVEAAVAAAERHFGRLDCIVNNAGFVGSIGSIMEMPVEHWRATLAVLQDGVFYGIKHGARAMSKHGGGSILSISSVAGLNGGFGAHAYTVAKHAVIGLTRTAASELARLNIRVNAVAPGTTLSPLIAGLVDEDYDAATKLITESSPMGATLMPADIAATLAFLASDAARLITGQVLAVDAGATTARTAPPFHSAEPAFIGPASLVERFVDPS